MSDADRFDVCHDNPVERGRHRWRRRRQVLFVETCGWCGAMRDVIMKSYRVCISDVAEERLKHAATCLNRSMDDLIECAVEEAALDWARSRGLLDMGAFDAANRDPKNYRDGKSQARRGAPRSLTTEEEK